MKNFITTKDREYERSFDAMLRGKQGNEIMENLRIGKNTLDGTYDLPDFAAGKFTEKLKKESIFRSLATTVYSRGDATIFAHDSEDMAAWVTEGAKIPFRNEGEDDFTKFGIGFKKLTTAVKADEDFIEDAGFNLTRHICDHMAKALARGEDDAFVNGDGTDRPTGILYPDKGAETGVTAEALTFDSVIQTFFSVKPEYRGKGKWLMNDNTALTLRTLKDADGNYLWNQSNDTILGKEVVICEFMPNAEAGKMPIAFGDFSYYWIIDRKRLSARVLKELYALNQQTAFLGVEYLDGMLVRREAVKTLCIG